MKIKEKKKQRTCVLSCPQSPQCVLNYHLFIFQFSILIVFLRSTLFCYTFSHLLLHGTMFVILITLHQKLLFNTRPLYTSI